MFTAGLLALTAPAAAAAKPTAAPPEDRSAPSESMSETTDIEELATELLERFPEFSEVAMESHGSILVLSGSVPNKSAHDALSSLVKSVGDVSFVWNKTVIKSSKEAESTPDDSLIKAHLEGIFSNVEGLREVQVEVRSQVVTLRGESPSEQVIERAEQLARDTKGVVFVENRIRPSAQVGERLKPAVQRMKERFSSWVMGAPLLLVALVVIAMFVLAARFIRRIEGPFKFIQSSLLRDIVRQLLGTIIIAAGILIALELLELTTLVGAVFGAAGAAGLILGFAFRDIIENYLASIILSVRRPFSSNDHVVIGSHEGMVLRLTSRDTILMTLEGNHLRLPNSLVFKAEILNYTRNPLRRFDFAVGLSVDEDIAGAIKLGRSTLITTPGVTKVPPPFARVEELGESNVALRYFCWVDQREADWFKVRSEAIRRTKVGLDAAGVEMPAPIYQVNLNQPGTPQEKSKAANRETLESEAHEVTVDAYIEEQIAADRRLEGEEENLLEDAKPKSTL